MVTNGNNPQSGFQTPSFIKALLAPNGKKGSIRKLWGIDVESVWVPFFTATNAMGDTHIPSDVLGAPVRLAYDRDGGVKFSATGRPVMKVAPELSDQVNGIVKDNYVAGLQAYTGMVQQEMPDQYKAQVLAAQTAGEPIHTKDMADQTAALAQRLQQAVTLVKASPDTKRQEMPEPPADTEATTSSKRHKVAAAA